MDSLSPQVLAAVCSYLPTADRLASRQLSTKFRCQPSDLPFIAMLTLQQDQNTFTFTVKYKRKQKELRQIEITKDTQKIDSIFTKSIENVEDYGQPREVHKTKVSCNRPSYYKFIDIYMTLFVRDGYLKIIRLGNLQDNFLAKLRKTIDKYHPNLNWDKEKRRLEMHTRFSELTQEERNFLNFCKNPRSLRFSPPKDFNFPFDFWNIPAISGARNLILDIGGKVGSNWRGDSLIETDLGIDDNFIKALLDKKKGIFICNTTTKITANFLINYTEELCDLTDFFVYKGFQATGARNEYIAPMGRIPKEGYYPDQMIMEMTTDLLKLQCDTGHYRGKMSIRDLNNPLNN